MNIKIKNLLSKQDASLKEIGNFDTLITITLIVGILGHLFYCIVFYIFNKSEIFEVKVVELFISISMFIIWTSTKKFYNFFVAYIHLNIMFACYNCMNIFGFNYGFLCIMLLMLSLGYIHNYKNQSIPIILSVVESIAILLAIYIFGNTQIPNGIFAQIIYVSGFIFLVIIVIFYALITDGIHIIQERSAEDMNLVLNQENKYDHLTQLLNRQAMINIIAYKIQEVDNIGDLSISAALIDIDNFYDVNTKYGYNFGDTVIKNIANILQESLDNNKNVFISRWGGNEFLLFFTNSSMKEVGNTLELIKNHIANYSHSDGYHLQKCTISVGLCYANGIVDVDTLLSKTTDNLLKSKQNGKNQITSEVIE